MYGQDCDSAVLVVSPYNCCMCHASLYNCDCHFSMNYAESRWELQVHEYAPCPLLQLNGYGCLINEGLVHLSSRTPYPQQSFAPLLPQAVTVQLSGLLCWEQTETIGNWRVLFSTLVQTVRPDHSIWHHEATTHMPVRTSESRTPRQI